MLITGTSISLYIVLLLFMTLFLTPKNKYEGAVSVALSVLIFVLVFALTLYKWLAPWMLFEDEGDEEQNINYNTFKTVERNIEYSSPGMVERCSICLVDFINGERVVFLLPCLHYFHIHCIGPWIRSHSNCPLCRRPIHRASKGRSTS